MLATTIAATLLVLALVGVAVGMAVRKNSHKSNARRGDYIDEGEAAFGTGTIIVAALLALIGLVVALLNMVHVVGANEAGVPVTLGKAGEALHSGLNVTAPWTNVETLPTRPKTVTTTANIRTHDAGHVSVVISARWGTSREDARELYLQARSGNDDAIEKDIVTPQVQGAANEFYGTLPNTDAIDGAKWAANATGVSEKAKTRLARYGIELVDVQIREVKPDEATNNALAQYAAQVRKTQIAAEANNTAIKEAETRKTIARGQSDAAKQFKGLSETEIAGLCMLATERMNEDNSSRNLATYVTACGGSDAGVLVQSGK